MPERPKFSLFVRSVTGRLVTYYPTGTFIGARRATLQELDAGGPPLIWDTDRVTPITEEDHARYRKEFEDAFRFGDLIRCTEEEWRAWCELEAKRAEQQARERTPDEVEPQPAAPALRVSGDAEAESVEA